MEWHNWLATPREVSAGDSIAFLSTSGTRNHGSLARGYGLKKVYHSQDHWTLTGAARDGAYAVNLKLIARGNWRKVGLIDYQIGRKTLKQKKSTVALSNHAEVMKHINVALQSVKLSTPQS